MAWKGEVLAKREEGGKLFVDIEYSEDITKDSFVEVNQTGTYQSDWVEKTVKIRVAQLESLSQYNIKVGAVDTPAVVDPAINIYFEKVEKYKRLLPLIEAGVIEATDTRITALTDAIKAGLTTYWDSM